MSTVALAACTHPAPLPFGFFVTPGEQEHPPQLDQHFSGTDIQVWYPQTYGQGGDLQKLSEIVPYIAQVEVKSAGFMPEHGDRAEGAIAVAFRVISSTIRMVSIEGKVEVRKDGALTYRFRDIVYDRRQNRLLSLSEMFEDKWPDARSTLRRVLVDGMRTQAAQRGLAIPSEGSMERRVNEALNGIPQWVLVPGIPNRTASAIRFDFEPEGTADVNDVFQVTVPVSEFWQYLSYDWRQRFTEP